MGASKRIKMILLDKDMQIKDLAEKYSQMPRIMSDGTVREKSGSLQTTYNMIAKDNMTFATIETMLNILDCDIVFRDRKTGKLYE